MTDRAKSADILLVEDNPGDVRLAQEAFKGSKIRSHLFVAENGVEALEFLRRQGKYARAPRPDLILLDLNLPVKSGREVLAEVKADESLRRIPVIVMTLSAAEDDLMKCYDHHANCYIQKPLEFEQFIAVARLIEQFWLGAVKLPPKEG